MDDDHASQATEPINSDDEGWNVPATQPMPDSPVSQKRLALTPDDSDSDTAAAREAYSAHHRATLEAGAANVYPPRPSRYSANVTVVKTVIPPKYCEAIVDKKINVEKDSDDDSDDDACLHEPAVDKLSMRRIMLKEYFVRAFLAREEPTYRYTYSGLMRLVTVELSATSDDVQFEVCTKDDPILVDKLMIWYREPSENNKRPFSIFIIEEDRVLLEGTKENIAFCISDFFKDVMSC